MKNFFFMLIGLLLTVHATAGVDRRSQDIKLPTQMMIEKQSLDNVAAASTNNVLNAFAGDTSGVAVSTSTFLLQPDFARNLVVTPGGTTADVAAGDVIIYGKNALGATISETFSFLANASTAVTGSKAFASITSITFPAEDSPYGATWSVGFGAKLGLKRCMNFADDLEKLQVNGTAESASAVAANATAIESNTITATTAPNATNDYIIKFEQNWRCY